MKGSAITAEDAAKNPQAVLDVLEFYTEQTKREAEEYGSSHLQGAVERRSDDRWAALMHEPTKQHHRPAPPRPAPPPPIQMMEDLSIRSSVSFFFFKLHKTSILINFFSLNHRTLHHL